MELSEVLKDEGSPSQRQYNVKFAKVYNFVRKSLVILRAKKITKKLQGEELYKATLDMLEKAKEI